MVLPKVFSNLSYTIMKSCLSNVPSVLIYSAEFFFEQ